MKIRNLLIISLAVISLSGFLTVFSFAAEPETNNAETEIVTRAEITEWHYKIVNGAMYKRLWSISAQKWLTEWMPV
jgi:hypothetical protein